MDGFWALGLERRGASEVVAIDILDPTRLDHSAADQLRGERGEMSGVSGRCCRLPRPWLRQ
jgi:hypothetical protein